MNRYILHTLRAIAVMCSATITFPRGYTEWPVNRHTGIVELETMFPRIGKRITATYTRAWRRR